MVRGFSCVVAAVLAGCGFSVTAAPGDGGRDTPIPDAGECTGASLSCAGPGLLRTCPAIGDSFDTPCPWGCRDGSPAHCGVFTPAGGALVTMHLDPTGLVDVTVGPATLNGDNGLVSGAVTGTFTYQLVGNVGVFRAKSIRFAGVVDLRGSHPIAFAADGDIIVAALIDARGSCILRTAGPGGSPGGQFLLPGGGLGGGAAGIMDLGNGAGGGGHGALGGNGGAGDSTGALGGTIDGDAAITVLTGGSGGGGGGGGNGNFDKGVGAGGGGAVQLASNGRIRIEPTGSINAGGCGGKGSNNEAKDGSGGGGSGGTILLEAPTVEILGVLAVNGGGGGACKLGDGAVGPGARIAASGGTALVNGGPGGFALSLAGTVGASNNITGGGGGGGVGRIRVNTRDGAVLVPGATMSPGFVDDPTTATKSMANIQ